MERRILDCTSVFQPAIYSDRHCNDDQLSGLKLTSSRTPPGRVTRATIPDYHCGLRCERGGGAATRERTLQSERLRTL